jgi:hypothetical protein
MYSADTVPPFCSPLQKLTERATTAIVHLVMTTATAGIATGIETGAAAEIGTEKATGTATGTDTETAIETATGRGTENATIPAATTAATTADRLEMILPAAGEEAVMMKPRRDVTSVPGTTALRTVVLLETMQMGLLVARGGEGGPRTQQVLQIGGPLHQKEPSPCLNESDEPPAGMSMLLATNNTRLFRLK